MGIEYALVDTASKTYFLLGKGFGPDMFGMSSDWRDVPFGVGSEERMLTLWREDWPAESHEWLKELAAEVWTFLVAHPAARLWNDCSDDIPDDFTLVGSRYTKDKADGIIGLTNAQIIQRIDEENV